MTGADGRLVHARAVVWGTGPPHRPALPDIDGLDEFADPAVHSSRWDHDHDLAGRRVAVVGTGASAIQFVPHIRRAALILSRRAARRHSSARSSPGSPTCS